MERSYVFSQIEDEMEQVEGTSFRALEECYKHDELLDELAREVIICARRYFQIVIKFDRLRDFERFHLEEAEYRFQMGELDLSRRLTHISLCDKLAILARTSLAQGIDNEWFEKIAGRNADREAIKKWALRSTFEEISGIGEKAYAE
jgi:hypothetical protein